MPRLTGEQWRQLRELAGLPGENDAAKVVAAAAGRLRRPRFDPRRRDQVIAAAVAGGKFGVERVPFYASLWESDPAGTERLITNLAAIPPSSAATTAPEADDEYSHLWPPDYRPYTAEERQRMQLGPTREQTWAAQDERMAAEAAARPHPEPALSDAAYEALFGPDN